ncbi:MAG: gamma-glutamylcyclotransferase family protein [Pseudomonadota bacterium]
MILNYFAFGSNLSSRRLLQRLPQARVHCVATLSHHRLCWRKNDQGQSGKCDIEQTSDPDHLVYGVVYQMTVEEQLELDKYESAGYGYERKEVEVLNLEGEPIPTFTYYALDILDGQPPFHWYKEHVLRGAIEHDFPQHYIETIRATVSKDDHDSDRIAREVVLYEDLSPIALND